VTLFTAMHEYSAMHCNLMFPFPQSRPDSKTNRESNNKETEAKINPLVDVLSAA